MGHAKSWTERLLLLLTTISRQSGGILAEYALVIAIITLGSLAAVVIIGVATSSFYTDFLDAGPFPDRTPAATRSYGLPGSSECHSVLQPSLVSPPFCRG